MDAQTVKLHPSVLLTPTWKGPYLASSLLNTPSPDGYLLPVSLRLLLRLCCLDNLCPLLCLHYDSGSLFSDKLLDELIQNIIPIFDKKLKRVILFGSYARGDYDEESDIDVMFLIDDEAKILYRKYRKPVRRIISDIDFKYSVLLCSVLQTNMISTHALIAYLSIKM